MSTSLQSDDLLRSVGHRVRNSNAESIGKVVEIISDGNTNVIQYIILQSYAFSGTRERYFAIPASPILLKTDIAGKIILKISTDDLILAKGTYSDHYPKPHLETGQPIFELYNYHKKDDTEKNT